MTQWANHSPKPIGLYTVAEILLQPKRQPLAHITGVWPIGPKLFPLTSSLRNPKLFRGQLSTLPTTTPNCYPDTPLERPEAG